LKPQRHVKAKLVLGCLLTSMLRTGKCIRDGKNDKECDPGFRLGVVVCLSVVSMWADCSHCREVQVCKKIQAPRRWLFEECRKIGTKLSSSNVVLNVGYSNALLLILLLVVSTCGTLTSCPGRKRDVRRSRYHVV